MVGRTVSVVATGLNLHYGFDARFVVRDFVYLHNLESLRLKQLSELFGRPLHTAEEAQHIDIEQ